MAKKPYSPLIYSYLKKWQEDPSSRVFAPLAEAYRKAGLVDEAIEIARDGLRIHPQFVGGRVALARALFDKKDFAQVIQELGPIIQDVPDNLVAQRLLAESCLMLGRVADALNAYKMLLYFSPGDQETAKMVRELEAQAYENGALVLRTDPPKIDEHSLYNVRSARGALEGDPEVAQRRWIQRVEKLQGLLLKVQRYKIRTEFERLSP
jgi:tetratricopeptide (TPR) repeat protein